MKTTVSEKSVFRFSGSIFQVLPRSRKFLLPTKNSQLITGIWSGMKKPSMKKAPNGVSGEEIEELIKPGKKSAMKKAGQKGLEGEWLNIGLLMVL